MSESSNKVPAQVIVYLSGEENDIVIKKKIKEGLASKNFAIKKIIRESKE